MWQLLAVVASRERLSLIERTREGLEAASDSGRRGGRRAALTVEEIEHAQQMRDKGKSASDIAAYSKVSGASVYRVLGRAT